MSFQQNVWDKLTKIDVSDHVEKKMNLSYLSWAWAWATLMENYPESSYEFAETVFFEDGTAEVWVSLTVAGDGDSVTRRMWLPVMDNRNNSIQNPTSRQISDTRMRCLVKGMAMFGLGHYIYAGEDLPEGSEPITKEQYSLYQRRRFMGLLKRGEALEFYAFNQSLPASTKIAINSSFEKGSVSKTKAAIKELEEMGKNAFDDYMAEFEGHIVNGDDGGVLQLWEDSSSELKSLLLDNLKPEEEEKFKVILNAVKEAA